MTDRTPDAWAIIKNGKITAVYHQRDVVESITSNAAPLYLGPDAPRGDDPERESVWTLTVPPRVNEVDRMLFKEAFTGMKEWLHGGSEQNLRNAVQHIRALLLLQHLQDDDGETWDETVTL